MNLNFGTVSLTRSTVTNICGGDGKGQSIEYFKGKNNIDAGRGRGRVLHIFKGRKNADAMVYFVTKAINAFDENCSIFLDLQKVFDCLDYNIIFDRLYSLVVRGQSL